jgi:3',5'-cyclic AMP phosphodiesterase CpdA
MPGIFYRPLPRRSFLRFSALGAAAIATGYHSIHAGASSDDEFHLALLSDTHIPAEPPNGHRGFDPTANLRQVIPGVVEAKPAGIIINGDAARLEGKPGDYAALKQILEPAAAVSPIFIGLGNHDDRDEFREVFPPAASHAQAINGKHVLVVEHPVVRVLVLDSLLYVNKSAGLLGLNQRNWLAGYLPDRADRPIVLFVHHTLKDGDGDLLDVERLFELLKPHPQVKAVFYGHSHVWETGQRDRVQLINLPAVGYNFRDQDPVGWVDARFRKDQVSLTLHAIAGNRTDDGRQFTVRWS